MEEGVEFVGSVDFDVRYICVGVGYFEIGG